MISLKYDSIKLSYNVDIIFVRDINGFKWFRFIDLMYAIFNEDLGFLETERALVGNYCRRYNDLKLQDYTFMENDDVEYVNEFGVYVYLQFCLKRLVENLKKEEALKNYLITDEDDNKADAEEDTEYDDCVGITSTKNRIDYALLINDLLDPILPTLDPTSITINTKHLTDAKHRIANLKESITFSDVMNSYEDFQIED